MDSRLYRPSERDSGYVLYPVHRASYGGRAAPYMQTVESKMRLGVSDELSYMYRVMGSDGKARDTGCFRPQCRTIASGLLLNLEKTCFCYVTLRNSVLDKIVSVGTIEPSFNFPDPLSRREFGLVS